MRDLDLETIFAPRGNAQMQPQLTGYHTLLRQLRSADAALASVRDAIIQTDHEDGIVQVNRAAEQLTGIPHERLVGRPLNQAVDLVDPSDEDSTVRRGQPLPEGTFRVLRQGGGGERLVLISMTKHTHGRIYVLRDVAADGVAPTGHDALTGLPDRQFLEQRLAEVLADRGRGARQLLYLDLDQFKVVNDLCGHRAGDQLLRQLTGLWQAELQHGEVLARLGGDEFCAVLSRHDVDAARRVGDRLIGIAQTMRFDWSGQVFRIGASAGLVDFVVADCADTLLAAADSACWAAKDNGRNRVHVFHPGDRELIARHEQMGWLSRIARAIDEDRLVLHYQRIEPLAESSKRGPHAEILVRMLDECGELVVPDEFIPAAERFNLMPRLDRWVVEQVCIGLGRKHREGDGPLGTWAINLSGTTFNDARFTDYVRECITRHSVPPGAICFELTETAAISNLVSAREFIDSMRALGCTIALDDFGSGVSSFAALKTLSIDYLKIDGSFVRNIHGDEIDRAMVEAIHRVGQVMGIPTVAEFVEDEAVSEWLRRIGVNFGQGFAIHRPERWPWGPQLSIDLVLE
ncbi:MAG: EAL domain-containing protein [Xanthomonadaceae bacterium]|nr:EAL domain-containing protein [Xanthomonadaceae bacterium]